MYRNLRYPFLSPNLKRNSYKGYQKYNDAYMVEEEDLPEDTSPKLKQKLEELESEVDKPTQITRIKRLQKLQDKLEGTHEIDRIKKLKGRLLIPQILGILILFPLLMYLNGASLDPLYFPIYYPILMLFGWILILLLESFVFRMMRIKRHRSKSTKYILVKNSMKKSFSVMIVALIIFASIYAPFLTEEINERSSVQEGLIEIEEDGHKELRLTTQGVLSLRKLKNVTIKREDDPDNADISVTLSEKNGEELKNDTLPQGGVTFDEFDNSAFKELLLNISSSERVSLKYKANMGLLEEKMNGFSILAFFYVGMFLQWPAILYPFRQKYTGEGIYR